MRALLVVNPKATTTSGRGQDVLARALRSEVELEVEYTRRRGHAAELARRAVKDGYDLLVTLGGDGTVNEVINGC
jgi:Sphingosine kinase and enzymes related to eukaryotic diacylglycerol kinase